MKNERKKLTRECSSLLLNYILYSFTTKAAAELFLNVWSFFTVLVILRCIRAGGSVFISVNDSSKLTFCLVLAHSQSNSQLSSLLTIQILFLCVLFHLSVVRKAIQRNLVDRGRKQGKCASSILKGLFPQWARFLKSLALQRQLRLKVCYVLYNR